jgi:uncharacterized membrane protein
MTIRNPLEWGAAQLRATGHVVGAASHTVYHADESPDLLRPAVRTIGVADLREALARGIRDFGACRTDVLFISVIYPVVGLLIARLALGQDLLPLLFPIASGFALIGPFAAIGLYEMSRRREQGVEVSWTDAFGVVGSPLFGRMVALGIGLICVFVLWLFAAQLIYDATLGPESPTWLGTFLTDVFTTREGWTMIVVGCGVGFLFAVFVLATTVVSFPLLLDRDVGIDTAVWTSVRAVARNPGPMALWGLIVAAGLVLGSIPAFVGLIVVMPVLGHATWHLYRRLVVDG